MLKAKKKRRSSSALQRGKGTAGKEAGMSQLGKGIGILWSGECARRCTAVGVRIDNRRSHSDPHRMQMV